ncbi:hypothetical protein CKA32_003171 [Geitlerinema sp. FC II]|nr:hypothetical protein CKA32_003171 [Geitlerinema sp. FC II]
MEAEPAKPLSKRVGFHSTVKNRREICYYQKGNPLVTPN